MHSWLASSWQCIDACFKVNDRKREIAPHVPSRAALGLPGNGFVFCNFNQSYKITPAQFESWMRILRAVPDSVLWLRSASVCTDRKEHSTPDAMTFIPFLFSLVAPGLRILQNF